MATYTNLTNLANLKVGDTVNYSVTTAFDAKGYKFKVELYGKKVSSSDGGLTTFTIDTSLLPETILSYNSRGDLIYGNSADLYYRIAVAGDAGSNGASGLAAGGRVGGKGGGSTGQKGGGGPAAGFASSDVSGGAGGTQTTGYSFGYGASSSGSGGAGGAGGYGWYGGYSGGKGEFYGGGGGGGGSGFIIGVSTSSYPSGYLGNNTSLQNTVASSISNGTLTQGGSTSYSAKMTITILAVPSGANTQSVLNYYNGTEFINTNVKYYNGTEFIDCDAYYYNGSEFKKV